MYAPVPEGWQSRGTVQSGDPRFGYDAAATAAAIGSDSRKAATRLLGGDDHCRVADDPGVIGDEALNLRDAFLFGRVRAEISFQRLEEDGVGNVRRSRTSCRLRAGLRNARAKGKKFGRPR